MTVSQRTHFDLLYRNSPDPWGYEIRWYEKRKRAILLASLSRPRYGLGYEPACGNGVLTAELALRCDRLVASDMSPAAVALSRKRLGTSPGVGISCATIPDDWIDEKLPCDLIVISEIGYYLADAELQRLAKRIEASLAPDGELVACHWRGQSSDRLRDSEAVHACLGRLSGLHGVAHHKEADFLLDVWSRGNPSVLGREKQ